MAASPLPPPLMVLWIGVDDTDSLRGMCTTFLATEFVRELTKDLDLIGYPRLVRLNPNIPWKTRGNGAVCMRAGHGTDRPSPIGVMDGKPVLSFPRGTRAGDPEELLERLGRILERWAKFDDPTTHPGLVVLSRRPPPSLYWRAVRDIVSLDDVLRILPGRGAWRGYKEARGLVGASAAIAWRPRDRTYELLAYRHPSRWGTPRELSPDSVLAMDRLVPTTFNNVDRGTRRVAIAPHSACPVLYGIRGSEATDLPEAFHLLRGETPERWLIVESNQGTDDHIRWDDWSFRRWLSTSVAAKVASAPRTLPGGHVLVEACGKGDRRIDLAFYEPSKDFRRVARALLPGDRVRVWGSLRDDLRSLNVEKLRIDGLVPRRVRQSNPACPVCGKRMKSVGKAQGFRCVHRHAVAAPGSGVWKELRREVVTGWYEPPVYARRHLARPLSRMAWASGRGAGGGPHPERPPPPDLRGNP